MLIKVLRIPGTKYYYKALTPYPVNLHFDYSKDYKDRLRKAQQWNRGNSIIYGAPIIAEETNDVYKKKRNNKH
jgi:hypothetical protein